MPMTRTVMKRTAGQFSQQKQSEQQQVQSIGIGITVVATVCVGRIVVVAAVRSQ